MLKLEVGGGDSRTLLLRDEFRCRIITYSAKIKKEKRERDSKSTRKRTRQTDPLAVWELLLVVVHGRRERWRFPLKRVPLGWGAGEQSLNVVLPVSTHVAFPVTPHHLPIGLSRLGTGPRGDQAHTASGFTTFPVYWEAGWRSSWPLCIRYF